MSQFNTGESSITIPNPTLTPDGEKNEDYHKKNVIAITNRAINYNFDLNYAAMTEAYKYFDGTQSNQAFNFLTEAEDGSVLPASWINYNSIRNKVEIMVGELANRGYEIKAKTINSDAVSRKLDERETMRVDYRLSGIADTMRSEYGMPVGIPSQELPESEEEIDEFFSKSYKEKSELVMEGMLKYIAKMGNWDYTRLALFRDELITGRAFCKNEIINGVPTPRRIDPRLIIFDPNSENDLLTDSTFWGEVRYMDFSAAAEMYGLTNKELKEAYNAYKSSNKSNIGLSSQNATAAYGALAGSELKWFKEENGGALRVLVVTAFWKDTKNFDHKKSVDKYGETHYKRVSDTYAPSTGEEVIRKRIPIWRTGTLIGGTIFPKTEWGEMKNQDVDVDTFTPTTSPYFGVIPNYVNYNGISVVQQLKGLQDLKNITMYNIQLAMARAGSKGFVYDVAQVPEGWDIHTAIKYLKTVGIAFIDSEKDGTPKQFNQFQQLDLSLSQSVEQYINIMNMIDSEMQKISGINDSREGQSGQYTTVGVAQAGMMQSNMMTATKFKMFSLFVDNIFNGLAGLGKVCWAGKEKFASIIGDVGINFLKDDVDLHMNNYGVFVMEVPPALDDKQNFQAIVMAALQAGQLEFVDAMKLLREDDMSYAIRQLERDIAEKKQEEAEQQAMLQEQQAKAQQAQQQAMLQAQQQQQQMRSAEVESKNKTDLSKIDRKGEWDMKQKAAEIKNASVQRKTDFAKDLILEGIRKKNEKRAQGK